MSNEAESLISEIIFKLDTKIIDKLKNWGKIVQLIIDEESYFVNFQNDLNLIKGETKSPEFTILCSLLTFKNILNGEINAVEAVASGEVTINGSLTSALEFSEIINEVDINS